MSFFFLLLLPFSILIYCPYRKQKQLYHLSMGQIDSLSDRCSGYYILSLIHRYFGAHPIVSPQHCKKYPIFPDIIFFSAVLLFFYTLCCCCCDRMRGIEKKNYILFIQCVTIDVLSLQPIKRQYNVQAFFKKKKCSFIFWGEKMSIETLFEHDGVSI